MTHTIVFTGGGTAGHVTPNIPLIETLKEEGWTIHYVGSAQGIEAGLIKPINIPFHGISSGKLRRYFSWQNFLDPFKILWGMAQSWRLLRRIKPEMLFSKGGFVAFPVVFSAWVNRIPIIAHESDITPGLANRLSFPFVDKICLTFAAAEKHFKSRDRVVVTGNPIREELLQGNKQAGLDLCGFTADKPCLLVIGGSMGAGSINTALRGALPVLLKQYQIIHLCGKGKLEPKLEGLEGYKQLEYANEELADFFAAADLILSRAGANSLYEILALSKPHILVPLSAKASRGDQIQNARYFKQLGVSLVIEDEQLDSDTLTAAIEELDKQSEAYRQKIKELNIVSATPRLIQLIKEQIHA